MLQSILDSVSSFTGAMKKDTCYQALDFLKRSINDELIPVFKDIISRKEAKFITNNELIKSINKMAEIKAANNIATITAMNKTFDVFLENMNYLEELIDKHIEINVTSKTMSVKSGAIIKVLQDLMSMTSYTLDLLYFMLINADKEKRTDLPKVKLKQITEIMPTYCEMYRVYSVNFHNTLKALGNITEEKISALVDKSTNKENNSDWVINTVLEKSGGIPKLPNSQGFIGNPIYHFRMWLVDQDIKKYESLKTKKQLIELKLMELRLKQNNEDDPSLAKQITYYEEKLSQLEYDITKLEK